MQGRILHDSKLLQAEMPDPGTMPGAAPCARRTLLGAAVALMPCLPIRSARADDPSAAPPQQGDHFVFLTGAKKGEPVHSTDLVPGGPQMMAYPADPAGVLRNGSRLNLVILARIGDTGLDEATAADAADGVVAYSAVCTHQGCPVNMWSAEHAAFVCSCHASTYDPRRGAEVISGPAPHPLPALKLKSDNGLLLVAAGFSAPVGPSSV